MTTYVNWLFFDPANKHCMVNAVDVNNALDKPLRDLGWDAELKRWFRRAKFRAGGIHFWRVC
jgi:hypothetical protein